MVKIQDRIPYIIISCILQYTTHSRNCGDCHVIKGVFSVLIRVIVLTSRDDDIHNGSILETVSISATLRLEEQQTEYDRDNLWFCFDVKSI